MDSQESLDLGLEAVAEGPAVSSVRRPHVRDSRVFRNGSEPCLDRASAGDLLAADHPARAIRRALERIDLSSLRESYHPYGGVAYDPRDTLGILCLAYFLGITGSGAIAEHCRYDVRFLHVSRGQSPDARSIRRLRARLAPVMEELFLRVVQACQEEGLVGGRRVALDGTKIASSASQLKRWLNASEREDLEGMGLEPESSDPEARVMRGSQGFLLGYNAQAAVDCDGGITVAVGVTDSSADSGSLLPMVDQIVRNLGDSDFELVADAGYDSNEGLQACEALGVEVAIAQQGDSAAFWSVVDEAGTLVCPMGRVAELSGYTTQRGKPVQVLRVSGCPDCIFFGSCCTSRSGRSLKIPADCDPAERILAFRHLRTQDGREAMKERMSTVEPTFGDVKANKGMRRFRMRGKEGAEVEWALAHMARNLAKLGKALLALLLGLLLALRTLFDVPSRVAAT